MTNKQVRILMFAPWFPPHRNSEAHTTGNLVLAMLKKGWHIDIISEPRYELFDKMQFSSYWSSLAPHCHPVPVRKKQQSALPSYAYKILAIMTMKHPITGSTWALYAFNKAMALHKEHHYDVVLSRSPALCGHLPALHFSKKAKIPWIANWNDLEPASRAPVPYNKGRDNKADFFTERFVRKVVDAATHHTLPSKRLLHYMTYWVPDLKSKASVIPHIALENNSQIQHMIKSDKFTICHAGIFDGRRNPQPLFIALELLFQKKPQYAQDFQLLLLGNNFESTFSYPIPPSVSTVVKVLPWCDYEQSLSIMQQSSILLIVEADMQDGIVLPAKLGDYVYCLRPILSLSPVNGTMHDLINNNGGGIVADCTSSSDIMLALDKLYQSWKSGLIDNQYRHHGLTSVIGEKRITAQYEALFSLLGVLK